MNLEGRVHAFEPPYMFLNCDFGRFTGLRCLRSLRFYVRSWSSWFCGTLLYSIFHLLPSSSPLSCFFTLYDRRVEELHELHVRPWNVLEWPRILDAKSAKTPKQNMYTPPKNMYGQADFRLEALGEVIFTLTCDSYCIKPGPDITTRMKRPIQLNCPVPGSGRRAPGGQAGGHRGSCLRPQYDRKGKEEGI
jgi:hypothetical protein